ncbi:hypothetical protein Tcan_08190 [Toxocara canis]|uniref:Uncharacterized protein n=1 Tax=Toxocara canis TaxID=6265 RepID=A0A0B2VRI6_TOXCA|nr:hypothetical protein Tcan_08190 [Toxocara canis]
MESSVRGEAIATWVMDIAEEPFGWTGQRPKDGLEQSAGTNSLMANWPWNGKNRETIKKANAATSLKCANVEKCIGRGDLTTLLKFRSIAALGAVATMVGTTASTREHASALL